MRQVFTIVSRETTEHPSRAHRLLIKLDGYLVLLPLFVEIAITYMDFATSGIGVALSSTGMAFLFSVEVLGFFLSLYLVTRCRKEQRALTDLLHRDHWA